MNPNLSAEQRRLWHRVHEAFAAQDLAELRALVLLAETGEDAPGPSTIDSLREEQERLRRGISDLLKVIEEVESRPPFTFRNQLEDDAWIAARRAETEKEIEELRTQRLALESYLQQLLLRCNERSWFSEN